MKLTAKYGNKNRSNELSNKKTFEKGRSCKLNHMRQIGKRKALVMVKTN